MIRILRSSRRVILRIKNLKKLTRAGIMHGSYVSGRGLVSAVSTEILKKNKTGRIYIRRDAAGRKRRHQASAAGQTHANMTGRLRRSLSFKVAPSQLEFGYGVTKGDAPEYAEFVNDGTSVMAPRPSLHNGIKSERRNMINNYEREIGKRVGLKVTVA